MTAAPFSTPPAETGLPFDPFGDGGFSGHPSCRMAIWRDSAAPGQPIEFTSGERARIDRLKSPARQREMEATFILRRRLIADMTGCLPEDIRLDTTASGAPLLVRPAGWTVSLANKREVTVAALAQAPGVIGVDVELVREIAWRPMLAMLCNQAEQSALRESTVPEGTALRRFFRMWTLKEAALKSTLEGFRAGPKSVETPIAIIEQPGSGVLTAFGETYAFWTADAEAAIISLVQRRA